VDLLAPLDHGFSGERHVSDEALTGWTMAHNLAKSEPHPLRREGFSPVFAGKIVLFFG
jgi:hypothetical protein